MADFNSAIAAIQAPGELKNSAATLDAVTEDLREPLPPPDRSFAAVMQNKSIATGNNPLAANKLSNSPLQVMSKELAQESSKQGAIQQRLTAQQSESKNEYKTEALAQDKTYRQKQAKVVADRTVSKTIETRQLLAQLDNIKQRVGKPQTAADSKVLLAINSAVAHPDAQAKLQQLQQGTRDLSGDLAVKPTDVDSDKTQDNFLRTALNTLTNVQDQLTEIVTDTSFINEKISTAELLSIQMRFAFVQQQIDFFSNAAAKALQNVSTLLNVQS